MLDMKRTDTDGITFHLTDKHGCFKGFFRLEVEDCKTLHRLMNRLPAADIDYKHLHAQESSVITKGKIPA